MAESHWATAQLRVLVTLRSEHHRGVKRVLFVAIFIVLVLTIAFGYSAFARRREAKARKAWEDYCNAQALANDAARFAKRSAEEYPSPQIPE